MTRVASQYSSALEKAVMLLLLVYPVLMFRVNGGMNGVFIIMLLLSLLVLIVRPKDVAEITWNKDWSYYAYAMASMTTATLLSQVANDQYGAHVYDAISRYWLGIPVFLLLQRMELKVFETLKYAFPAAAIIGSFWTHEVVPSRYGIKALDLIHFGDFALLLGVMSLMAVMPISRKLRFVSVLGWCGFIAGVATSFASGSRGGWLAIPVFIGIFILYNKPKNLLRTVLSTTVAAIVVATVLFTTVASFNQRVVEMVEDLKVVGTDKRDTDTGVRLQLYGAAIELFIQNPIFGVGPEGFTLNMQPMLEAGKLTPGAAEYGHGEVHNDLLAKAAGLGILGVIAQLVTYFVPLLLFWRAARSEDRIIRQAGLFGTLFIAGFFVFGFTVEFLTLTLVTAFYGFTIAVFLALCYNIHHPANQGGKHV